MSWITDLADKAENILNKIDQNAATALLTPESSPHRILTRTIGSNSTLYAINTDSTTIDINTLSSEDKLLTTKTMPENLSYDTGLEMKLDTIIPTTTLLNNNAKVDSRELVERLTANNLLSSKRDAENDILLKRLTEERDQAILVLQNVQSINGELAHSLSEQESNYAKLQQKYVVLTEKFEMQLKEANTQREEFQKYRTRAQKALQAKDSIIDEINNSNVANPHKNSIPKIDNDVQYSQNEFENLKEQLRNTCIENKNLLLQLEEIRHDLEASNKKYVEHSIRTTFEKEELQKELREYVEKILTSESEHRIMQQELESLRQQLSSMSTALASRENKERTSVNKVVREDNVRLSEYDKKLKALTQALVEKQNEFENVTASRNALRIQLEKVEEELKRTNYNKSSIANVQRNTLFTNNSTDDVKAQFPLLMTENPFDNRVARRMKKATRLIDTVGIRVGTFLRRYPLMRVGVLMYVALLHLWVMFVLFISTPN